MSDNYEPAGIDFYDLASGRLMKLITLGTWEGWIAYKHCDGQWVTLRMATYQDRVAIGCVASNTVKDRPQ